MALKRIVLRDFVIVQTMELDLHEGFTALTGETGAGKSILIEALQLILGGRSDAAVVREGAQRADLCAEFDGAQDLAPWLEEAGFDAQPDLLLRRTIDATGKSRAWINGLPATAAQLRHLGERLIDIHGQHAWQSLTRADAVRDLLDSYAGASPHEVTVCWARWREALRACAQARSAQDQLQQERERLQWQLSEMDKLSPAEGEWDSLNAQHTRLTHALALTDDALHGLHSYLDHTELDPDRLAQLDARVAQWLALARRHKRPAEELPALRQSWEQALQQLDAASDLATLEQAVQQHAKAYQAAAQALSRQRSKAAPRLSAEITAAMQELGMAGGQFVVQVRKAAEPAAHGLDDIDFLVAGHPGATPRPIGKIASGGELSRISLAIAVATSTLGSADTLIFDEVDAGVGGAVAASVGRLMRQIGQDRQVLAVTHLPQVAASAHHHLVVTKLRGEPTTSAVAAVEDDDRVAEIARMLGGDKPTARSLAHAREMLDTTAPRRKQA